MAEAPHFDHAGDVLPVVRGASDGDKRDVQMNRDALHPTGEVLCTKGKEPLVLIARPDRLRYPMTRTDPKGAVHSGWRRISSDEALDNTW